MRVVPVVSESVRISAKYIHHFPTSRTGTTIIVYHARCHYKNTALIPEVAKYTVGVVDRSLAVDTVSWQSCHCVVSTQTSVGYT